jgi:hypothetical protein
MAKLLVRGLKSVVLTSDHPDLTARFYSDVFAMPFEKEEHGDVPPHWACQFGGLHFAIHQAKGFWVGSGPPKDRGEDTFLTFTIEALEPFVEHLQRKQVPVVMQRNIGPMTFVTIRDPDGRHVGCGTPWPGT